MRCNKYHACCKELLLHKNKKISSSFMLLRLSKRENENETVKIVTS